MNKIDEIRVKLEECSREKDRWSNKLIDTDDVLEIIAPYLSHGITEEEARKWYRNLPTDPNQIEFMTEGNDLGLITSSRKPIAEAEHTIHTLAEDQKDLDPRINNMVNEKFWELVGSEPEKLIKAREKYTEYKNWKYRIDITYEMFVGAQDAYIRELEAHYCKEGK